MTRIPTRSERLDRIRLSQRVAADLAKSSLGPMNRPVDALEMVGDITDLHDEVLMSWMVRLTAWADYAGGQLAMAEIDLETLASAMKQMRDEHLVRTWEDEYNDDSPKSSRKGVTVRRAELEAGNEPYQELEKERLEAYAKRKLIAVRFDSFVRREALASRELTRRTGRDAPQRRSARGST